VRWKDLSLFARLTADRTQSLELEFHREPPALSPSALEALREVRTKSTSESRILHAVSYSDEAGKAIRVQFGSESADISERDWQSFLDGAEPSAELRALVEVSEPPARVIAFAPQLEAAAGGAGVADPVRFASALGRLFGDRTPVFLATDLNRALANIARLPQVRGPNDVVAYIPGESFGVNDYGALTTLRKHLKSSGIRVADGITVMDGGNTLVISGHKAESLHEYVSALGSAKALEGRYVVLFSCYAAGDAAFNARLIRDFGATGVHFFTEEINPYSVSDTLFQLGRTLQQAPGSGAALERLLRRAVGDAAGAADTEKQKIEIDKLSRGISQISRYGAVLGNERHG
jgi:hypothetical protein